MELLFCCGVTLAALALAGLFLLEALRMLERAEREDEKDSL